MRFSFVRRVVLLLLAGMLSVQSGNAFVAPCDIDYSERNGLLFVTLETARQVAVIRADSLVIENYFDFPVELSGLCISADEKTIYVTGGGAEGQLFVVDAVSGEVQRTVRCGHTPCAPVLSPDGLTLYVCNRFDNEVVMIDLVHGMEMARVPVSREPVAADVSADGTRLFVANLLPKGRADQDDVGSVISVIDTVSYEVSSIPLANGAESVRGIKVSPDGNYLFAVHFLARFLVSVTQIERGWVSTDGLSIIRVSDRSLVQTVLLDDVDMGFSNPWAIGFSDDAESLVVSAAGTHELSVINLPSLIQRAELFSMGPEQGSYHNLSALSGIRQRVSLAGNGPRSLVWSGARAYVANYFSDTIDVVDFSDREDVTINSTALSSDFSQPEERRGEQLFNDATLSVQQWLSCAACHPDGRTDGLNWDLVNDGLGNPKNAKSLLLAHETPESMWLAVHGDAEETVRQEIRSVLFASRPDQDAVAIDTYLRSMKPVPSPRLVKGHLSPSARRGKLLFETVGCARCHPAPLYTDLRARDVDTLLGIDAGRMLDTPSLVEAWRTAPYQHDGRAETLRDVIEGNHGRAEKMSDEQKADLAEFLNTL